MLRVLCVCTGNTCRSPMAEALLQREADRLGLPVSVSSAGLAAFPGDPASAHAVSVMAELDVDLSGHRARAVTPYLLAESDYVICMSESHRAALLPYVPAEKLVVLPGGVPDPFGGDEERYRATRDALQAFLCAWLAEVAAPVLAPLTEADLPAAAALEKACFSTPWSEESLRGELQNENARVWTLSVCREIVGYIGVHLVQDEAEVMNLAVLPAFRRRGFGRRLLQTALAFCRENGCVRLFLEVRESNEAALALYRSLGFTVCGRRKHYYQQPPEDALLLQCALSGEKDDPLCES